MIVKTAFVNGNFHEDVNMTLPEGLESKNLPTKYENYKKLFIDLSKLQE